MNKQESVNIVILTDFLQNFACFKLAIKSGFWIHHFHSLTPQGQMSSLVCANEI